MLNFHLLVCVVVLLVTAFSSLLICLCLDIIPIIKSRGSTLASRDSITKEQTKKFMLSLKRHTTELNRGVKEDLRSSPVMTKNKNIGTTLRKTDETKNQSSEDLLNSNDRVKVKADEEEDIPLAVSVHQSCSIVPVSNVVIKNAVVNSPTELIYAGKAPKLKAYEIANFKTARKLPRTSSFQMSSSEPLISGYKTEPRQSRGRHNYMHEANIRNPLVGRCISLPTGHGSACDSKMFKPSMTLNEAKLSSDSYRKHLADCKLSLNKVCKCGFADTKAVRTNDTQEEELQSIKSSTVVGSIEKSSLPLKIKQCNARALRSSPILSSSLHGSGMVLSSSSCPSFSSSQCGGRNLKAKLEDIKEVVSYSEEDSLLSHKTT